MKFFPAHPECFAASKMYRRIMLALFACLAVPTYASSPKQTKSISTTEYVKLTSLLAVSAASLHSAGPVIYHHLEHAQRQAFLGMRHPHYLVRHSSWAGKHLILAALLSIGCYQVLKTTFKAWAKE